MNLHPHQSVTGDSYWTIAAIALLAYLSADVAHHVLGHGFACLALGGRINSLTSVIVNCSLTGSLIDVAGPLANLLFGLLALAVARFAGRMSGDVRQE